MNKNELNKPDIPDYPRLITRLARIMSRLKSALADSIDAHHERAAELRVYQSKRQDGTGVSDSKR